MLNMTAEEVYEARMRRAGRSTTQQTEQDPSGSSTKTDNKIKKMMEALGWKGKGLGRDEQGILNPLIARKTDANSAVIVESSI